MPDLVLGPLLRYVNSSDANIWVETDAPCEVAVGAGESVGVQARTFEVSGHHYALLHLSGLVPGEVYEYEVRLDGERRWPQEDSEYPPSVIKPIAPEQQLKLYFGSCRISLPNTPPYSLRKDEDNRGREIDALYALARRMRHQPPQEWPDTLLLLGDQIYADEVSPGTREFIRSRRDPQTPPGESVADFEEYTHLYLDSWSDPDIRWLLSTVSTAMIFDDHDVNDDWNTSETWVRRMRETSWWDERIIGGFVSYWIYQHIGNLPPEELAQGELWNQVHRSGNATGLLRDFAYRADRDPTLYRWSFYRDLGESRLVAIDSRAGRILEPGHRLMVDDNEWEWIESHSTGGFDHLLLATSLPFMVGPGLHYLEAWNEAVCDGAWGTRAAKVAEAIRQAVDLEHWSAFHTSFDRLTETLRSVAAGERGESPASIVVLSGDVHHAYLAEAELLNGSGNGSAPVASPVYQAVCSPFRNPLNKNERRAIRFAWSKAGTLLFRSLARSAGVRDPRISWSLAHDEPWFNNQVASLLITGPRARMRLQKTSPGDDHDPHLETVFEYDLAR